MEDKIFFQKRDQKIFMAIFIVIMIGAFLGLSFTKYIAFSSLKESASSQDVSEAWDLKDGDVIYVGINGASVRTEVARSDQKKAQGLSDRYFLDENNGMLFVFDVVDIYAFWNNDTFIPLDIIWIENDKVTHILKGLPVYEGGERFTETPKEKANLVMEVNAGFVDKYNIKLGDSVIIKNNRN